MTRATIFARSSGPAPSGVAVFRLSGPLAGPVLDRLCAGRGEARRARLVEVKGREGGLIDQGLSLWFPGPRSFTGEDVAELHLHGSPAVEAALAEALIGEGLRPASAGEFTLRAFEAGKLDLAQAEGLGDLLEAETDAQRRQALGQLGGGLSEVVGRWRSLILQSLAVLESAIDFADEEGVDDLSASARETVAQLHAEMSEAVRAAGGARMVRRGTTVVVTGPPNVGKSSLVNKLAGSERALVSPSAGTTRDLVETRLDIGGQLVTLIDTAGLREAGEAIEAAGIARAEEAARSADLRLVVGTADTIAGPPDAIERSLFVQNKIDETSNRTPGWLPLSVTTGDGWSTFVEALGASLEPAATGVLTRDRHRHLVEAALISLEPLTNSRALPPEVMSAGLSGSLRKLEELIGAVSPDHVLGQIFSRFCVGK